MDPEFIKTLIDQAIETAIKKYTTLSQPINPEYLTTREAATYLGLSYQSLSIWRCNNRGPKYTKLSQALRYKKSDLDDFMRSHVKTPAKEGSHEA